MEWEGREESSNVEDRRGSGGRRGLAVGGMGGLVLIVLCLIFGVDPRQLMGPGGPGVPQPNGQAERTVDPQEERQASFTKVIFHDTEVVWDEQFRRMGRQYQKPTLVLYSGSVDSACGMADSAVGPFYCPGDAKVYIDLSFYRDMERKLNAPGDFARAYVVAHEVGHHVQRLLGFNDRAGDRGDNRTSVRMELQADFLAGVWAHYGQEKFHFLDPGDLKSAINAAFQIGDDRLQKQARGYVVPDSFTHGTSKQRIRWFEEGFKTGNLREAKQLFDLPYEEL